MTTNTSEIIRITDFTVDRKLLLQSAHIEEGDELEEEILDFADQAEKIALPKAVMSKLPVIFDAGGEKVAKLGEQPVSCALMDDQFQGTQVVYPYVATCGKELDEMDTFGDPLADFWLECIQLQALAAVQKKVIAAIAEDAGVEESALSHLNPGSLPVWPISEQPMLFKLVENPEETVGVRLSDSFLMFPIKSVSGILFHGKEHYENCSYCPRQDCPNRRATFVGTPYGAMNCDM